MKTEQQITLQDYLDSRRLSLRPRKKMRVLLYALMALLGFFTGEGIYNTLSTGADLKAWLGPLGISVYFAAIYYLVLPWKARRIYKQTKALQNTFTIEIADDVIEWTSPQGNARMNISDFHKWKMNRKMILLYHSDALYHIIPARTFGSAAERTAFETLLRQHLGEQHA